MTAIERAHETFDTFFSDDSLKVLVFKGPWGSGKSYFVRQYLDKSKKVPDAQYFVSLFGLATLNDVREAINAALRYRKGDVKSSGGFGTKARKAVGDNIGGLLTAVKDIPGIKDYASAVGKSLFWLIAVGMKSVVVFDDLERASLPKHLIFGLASNLAENTKAKVVIIYNEGKSRTTSLRN